MGRVIKDEKSSSIAAQRQFDAFTTWFDSWLLGLPKPDGNPSDLPTVDAKFLEYANKMMDYTGIPEYDKKKLSHVLKEAESSDRTCAETFVMAAKCLGKVSRARGSPNRQDNVFEMEAPRYEKHNCPVCKVAEKRLINNNDHDCPYCHRCFIESGRDKKIVRLDECTTHQANVSAYDNYL